MLYIILFYSIPSLKVSAEPAPHRVEPAAAEDQAGDARPAVEASGAGGAADLCPAGVPAAVAPALRRDASDGSGERSPTEAFGSTAESVGRSAAAEDFAWATRDGSQTAHAGETGEAWRPMSRAGQAQGEHGCVGLGAASDGSESGDAAGLSGGGSGSADSADAPSDMAAGDDRAPRARRAKGAAPAVTPTVAAGSEADVAEEEPVPAAAAPARRVWQPSRARTGDAGSVGSPSDSGAGGAAGTGRSPASAELADVPASPDPADGEPSRAAPATAKVLAARQRIIEALEAQAAVALEEAIVVGHRQGLWEDELLLAFQVLERMQAAEMPSCVGGCRVLLTQTNEPSWLSLLLSLSLAPSFPLPPSPPHPSGVRTTTLGRPLRQTRGLCPPMRFEIGKKHKNPLTPLSLSPLSPSPLSPSPLLSASHFPHPSLPLPFSPPLAIGRPGEGAVHARASEVGAA